jgi:hypothetical protein
MRLRFLIPAALAATLGLGTVSGVAFADPSPQDIAQARELGGQAQTAFDAGNFAESEKLWIAAANLYSAAPTLTLGLARTQVKLGKLVAAAEAYKKIIREQGDNPNLSPAFKDALESAKAELPPISNRIANVVITVDAPNPKVTIDGQPVSAAALGLKRPIDPGQHTVRAEAPGYKPAENSFQVADAGLAETKLTLEKAPDAPAAAGTPGSDQAGVTASTSGGSSNKTFALVAWGVGGLGLVVGGITGLIAVGKHGSLKDSCPDSKCPSTSKSDVDSYKTVGTISTIGFIAAGVGAAAGAVLWFTAPSESQSPAAAPAAARASWHPYVGLGSAGVTGRF